MDCIDSRTHLFQLIAAFACYIIFVDCLCNLLGHSPDILFRGTRQILFQKLFHPAAVRLVHIFPEGFHKVAVNGPKLFCFLFRQLSRHFFFQPLTEKDAACLGSRSFRRFVVHQKALVFFKLFCSKLCQPFQFGRSPFRFIVHKLVFVSFQLLLQQILPFRSCRCLFQHSSGLIPMKHHTILPLSKKSFQTGLVLR